MLLYVTYWAVGRALKAIHCLLTLMLFPGTSTQWRTHTAVLAIPDELSRTAVLDLNFGPVEFHCTGCFWCYKELHFCFVITLFCNSYNPIPRGLADLYIPHN